MHLCSVADMDLGSPAILDLVETAAGPRRRLAELGLRPGASVTVLRRTSGGGRIVAVAGSRVALDAVTAGSLSLRTEAVA